MDCRILMCNDFARERTEEWASPAFSSPLIIAALICEEICSYRGRLAFIAYDYLQILTAVSVLTVSLLQIQYNTHENGCPRWQTAIAMQIIDPVYAFWGKSPRNIKAFSAVVGG